MTESATGVLLGHRLPERTRPVVTDGIGLVTLFRRQPRLGGGRVLPVLVQIVVAAS